MKYKYNFYNILSVRSNIDLSDIVLPLDIFQEKERRENYDLTIRKTKHTSIDKKIYQQIAPGLYYSEEEDRIASMRRIFGIKVYWEIVNLCGSQTELLFNKAYLLFFKHVFQFPISSFYQLNILIKMIMQIKLLLKNSTFLAGSAAAFEKKGIFFTGMNGSGKTTMILEFMANFPSARYISDDMTILSEGTVYSFPEPVRVRRFNLNARFFKKLENPVIKYRGRFREAFNGNFDVYFLEKSSANYINEISNSDGTSKLCSINNRTLLYCSERLLSSYAYYGENFFLLNMQERQSKILSDFFKDANFYILCAKNLFGYTEMLKKRYK